MSDSRFVEYVDSLRSPPPLAIPSISRVKRLATLRLRPHPSRSPSIPPELLLEIFSAILLAPPSKRNATLASLCRVNRLFLRIARPLLYQEVRFNLNREYCVAESPQVSAFETLVGNEECADLVKSVRLGYRTASRPKFVIFAYLLSQLKNVESVKVATDTGPQDAAFVADFLLTIARHCPKLRHLELPQQPGLHNRDCDILFSAFPNLETFEGHLGFSSVQNHTERTDLNPFHLKRLVLRSPSYRAATITWLLSRSFDSLTTLSFRLDGFAQLVDLSPLRHLSSLHISYYPDISVLDMEAEGSVTWLTLPRTLLRLRAILATARDLPITDFLLTARLMEAEMREARGIEVDALALWAHDPSHSSSEYRHCFSEPGVSREDADNGDDWFSWSIIQESENIVKEGELSVIRAVADYGIKLGIVHNGALERFVRKRVVGVEEDEESAEELDTDEDLYSLPSVGLFRTL
ncbi:hypothetical protein JCM16303_006313 [Sporobolomyces ruberrimus]